MQCIRAVACVLVIDDDGARRRSVSELARDAGHHALEASSVRDAITLLACELVDVVLIDLALAVETNYAALIAVHDHTSSVATPIVVLVDDPEQVVLASVHAAGGDDLLVRPIRAIELNARLHALTRAYTTVRDARAAAAAATDQREELVRMAARKDALAEFLVHDLKSPLASVTLALQELLTLDGPQLDRDAVRACVATTETVARMVMNLLDVASGRELRVAPTWCDTGELCSHLRAQFAPRLDLRDVALATRAGGSRVWADPELLRRVAENLLDNAIRYAPPGSQIELVLEPKEGGGGLTVSDRGPGVPERHRERIFDRFAQLDPDAGWRSSRGLGLAFCRVVADAHGGRIWVDEPDGGGARFRLWLPGSTEAS